MEWLESFLDIIIPTNHVFHIEFLRPKLFFLLLCPFPNSPTNIFCL